MLLFCTVDCLILTICSLYYSFPVVINHTSSNADVVLLGEAVFSLF